jgi:hypothetical protein
VVRANGADSAMPALFTSTSIGPESPRSPRPPPRRPTRVGHVERHGEHAPAGGAKLGGGGVV